MSSVKSDEYMTNDLRIRSLQYLADDNAEKILCSFCRGSFGAAGEYVQGQLFCHSCYGDRDLLIPIENAGTSVVAPTKVGMHWRVMLKD
jgi:hypothetical protein